MTHDTAMHTGPLASSCEARFAVCSRKHAELAHQGQIVSDRPMLDALAALEPHDVDLLYGYAAVRWWYAHELTRVVPSHRAVNSGRVGVDEHLVDVVVQVREGSSQHLQDLPHPL